MYVRFELSHAGTCSIWKAGSPPPMMTFWIITSTSVGGHLLVSSEFIFALDEMTHCSKKHNVWQAGTIHGCLWCTWSEIWSMLKDLVITVSSRWWTGKKKRELQNQHVNSSTWINPRHDNARNPVYTCLYFLQDGSPLVMLSVDFDPMNYSDVSITKHRKA